MERQYLAVRAFGNPMQVFERIRQVLQAEELTRAIPSVKFEKGARREFFIFLTVAKSENRRLSKPSANCIYAMEFEEQHLPTIFFVR